ncbi:hypothetical protein ACMGDK_11480 [Chryseobacterium sp. DT-3]|uniref:hypothetical protein n=1 Tax=Chryseobacterium sp. DT-3 TaxID=3396164 RepID=UPI003F1A665D
MAVTVPITINPASYFIQVDEKTPKPLASSLEVSGLFLPKFIGRVIAEELDDTSLLAQLMISGNEFQVGSEQVVWKEEGDINTSDAHKATRATNDFTANPTSIFDDPYDIDSNRPTDVHWAGVAVGMNFYVVDSTGKSQNGVITALSTDYKKFTATPIGGDVAWTVGTDVQVVFYGFNLDDCECPPCVATKDYAPTYENSMFKDGECLEYCEETEIKEGEGAFDLFEVDGGYVKVDERLNQKQKELTKRMDNALAFAKRLTEAEATTLGQKNRGTNGIFPMLEGKAQKVEGMIETHADLEYIADLLRKQKVKVATLRCSTAQYSKLRNLVKPTSPYFFSPFENHQNDLMYIGFAGIDFGDVKIYFKQWNALDSNVEYLAKKYNFIIVPEGKLNRKINGQNMSVSYLNIGWFAGNGKVWKYLREDKVDPDSCSVKRTNYTNKFVPVIFMARKFILGINAVA